MRNVSKKFLETMEDRRDFYAVAKITFANETERTLSKEDFTISGNSITDSAESSSFPLGILAAKRINISLMNDDDRWSDYDFYGAKIFLQTKFDLDDGITETLNIGTFTVITPENYGTTVVITAMDDSYKTDIDYNTNLSYPLSAGIALEDSCNTCGITLKTLTFRNSDYVILSRPENLTHRQFIGMIAMIAGGNAVMDEYNRLVIKSYDFSEFEEAVGLDGGSFDDGLSTYQTGDSADGGNFAPWDTSAIADGGQFGDRNNIHRLYQFRSGITIGVDDVVITGVQIESEDEERKKVQHLYGTKGYVLSVNNQLATGKEDEFVAMIGQAIVGLRFRPFSGDHIALPTAEFMDLAYLVDRKNNVYQTVLTDINFTYYGFTELKCSADSPIRNSSKYYGNETKAIVESRKLVEKEKTDRELAIENLANQLANSSGLYMTSEKQDDGSTIYYMHNKPTLAESMIIWKLTAEAFAISTDGGDTYPYGLDASGVAILERIYAVGINADYIITGAFEVRKGDKVMVLMDKDTGEVILRPDIFELSSGETIDSIAEGKANEALESANSYTDTTASSTLADANAHSDSVADNALNNAKEYADTAAGNAVKNLSQRDVLDKLTNDGVDKGIYLQDGQLYISFSAMRGEDLTLGGSNNERGTLQVLNANGVPVVSADENGIEAIAGKVGGWVLTSTRIKSSDTITAGSKEAGLILTNKDGVAFIRAQDADGNITFRVKRDGTVTMAGDVDATGGTIAGWIIMPDYIQSTDGNITLHKGGRIVIGAAELSSAGGAFTVSEGLHLYTGSSGDFDDGSRRFKVFGLSHVSSGGHLVFDSDGATVAYSSSSSKRYKEIAGELTPEDVEQLYEIGVYNARYKDGYLSSNDERNGAYMPMFIAEDVEKYFPLAVDHDQEGRPENWNYRVMIPAMFEMLKSQKAEIEELKRRIGGGADGYTS